MVDPGSLEVVGYADVELPICAADSIGEKLAHVFVLAKRDVHTVVPNEPIPNPSMDVASVVGVCLVYAAPVVAEMEGGAQSRHTGAEDDGGWVLGECHADPLIVETRPCALSVDSSPRRRISASHHAIVSAKPGAKSNWCRHPTSSVSLVMSATTSGASPGRSGRAPMASSSSRFS